MSNGITLSCPSCSEYTAVNKEYDELKVKLFCKETGWYDSVFPVYTCKKCEKKWAIERVAKAICLPSKEKLK